MALVLLVEDHPTNRKFMCDVLEIRFDVVTAASAEEALERLQESTPQLILLDLQLPGMDGLTLVRRLKKDPKTREIPVVALSAHAMKQNIEEALAAGCAEYITKPLVEDPFAFVERLERMIAPTGC
jgi:two-component system cell cycle response regulator DivK